ncbi:hypothetical protein KC19_3G190100 [Ceratodon purpureus]|uniref:Uncharacterized protein n=1 Tax=Ceratodon purpureus TaxID=3225 RepID=A0A8T0IK64_CERPU|nr:hypothetical protein KC19_3G190100 [Ceratodon purpureus]
MWGTLTCALEIWSLPICPFAHLMSFAQRAFVGCSGLDVNNMQASTPFSCFSGIAS